MIYLFFLAVVGVSTANAIDKRIVNGEPARQGAHPHQITLQLRSGMYWYHICGGSLVARNKVLTAAHCVDGTPASSLRVGAGWHQLSKDSGYEQTLSVSDVSIHRNYNGNAGGFPNDIAMLTLANDVTINDYVRTVEIAPEGSSFAYERCIISGWGQLSGSGGTADTLKQASITKITNQQCANMWSAVSGARIYDTHICVYEQPKSSCSGDSGGPMICGDYLAGVTSWGISNCDGTFPSVYVRTSMFRDWIYQEIVA